MGIIPPQLIPHASRVLAGLELGERLCEAFELYYEVVPGATISMEQFILLVFALAERRELEISHCDVCHGILIVERIERVVANARSAGAALQQ